MNKRKKTSSLKISLSKWNHDNSATLSQKGYFYGNLWMSMKHNKMMPDVCMDTYNPTVKREDISKRSCDVCLKYFVSISGKNADVEVSQLIC